LSLRVDQPTTIQLGIKEIAAGGAPVRWSAANVPGLTLSTDGGVLTPPTSRGCSSPAAVTQSLTVDASTAGSFSVQVQMQTATGTALPPVVLDLVASS
jgi:hypothetical protein